MNDFQVFLMNCVFPAWGRAGIKKLCIQFQLSEEQVLAFIAEEKLRRRKKN